MELIIPSQTLEVNKIHLSSFQPIDNRGHLSLAPFHYNDQSIILKNINILTPSLTVINHDTSTGRLQLDTSEHTHFSTKIYTLQEYLLSTLFVHQQSLFGIVLTQDGLRSLFKTLIYKNKLTLFLGSSSRTLKYIKNNKEQTGLNEQIPQGTKIRCIINLQGIALIPGNPFNFRFQHSIKSIIMTK
jgi:hypothetical protein